MIKVIGVKVRAHDKEYKPGDTIPNLSPADEESLIKDGYAEKVEGVIDKVTANDKTQILAADEVIKLIEDTDVKEDIEKILTEELANKRRKTVLAAASAKLEKLSANADADDKDDNKENATNPEDVKEIVSGFNASDVIVPGCQA